MSSSEEEVPVPIPVKVPSDLVFEIISRTPSLKTLDSCKVVSKQWHELIYETNFMPLYCARTKNVSGYFVQDFRSNMHVTEFVSFDDDREGPRPTWSKLPKDTMILASCKQGILCCVTRDGRKYMYDICKPTTGQWKRLPTPILHSWKTVGAILVFGTTPYLRYKIIRLTEQKSRKLLTSYQCDMFDSKTWKWRRLRNKNLGYHEQIISVRESPSVTVANSIYWLTTMDNVVEFRVSNESFHEFPLPGLVRNNADYTSKRLVEYQGGLGLICSTECYLELWLKEVDSINNVITWRKKMELDVDRVEGASPIGFYNAGITLFKEFLEVQFYKIQDSSLNRVKLEQVTDAREVFPFRSDFEMVKLC
ncbi:hypothetical protein OROGR_010750 [Orobanche gracilis]